MTNSHVEIIEEQKKENKVVVMPVRFLNEKKEINSKSFPFNFETREKMIESVFGNSVTVSSNYTFFVPFKKYFPPLLSLKSWSLRKKSCKELTMIILHILETRQKVLCSNYID